MSEKALRAGLKKWIAASGVAEKKVMFSYSCCVQSSFVLLKAFAIPVPTDRQFAKCY